MFRVNENSGEMFGFNERHSRSQRVCTESSSVCETSMAPILRRQARPRRFVVWLDCWLVLGKRQFQPNVRIEVAVRNVMHDLRMSALPIRWSSCESSKPSRARILPGVAEISSMPAGGEPALLVGILNGPMGSADPL